MVTGRDRPRVSEESTGLGVQQACVNLSSHTSQLGDAGEAPRFSESQFFSSVQWAQSSEEEVGGTRLLGDPCSVHVELETGRKGRENRGGG